jgi:FixJ family two-component response regulator
MSVSILVGMTIQLPRPRLKLWQKTQQVFLGHPAILQKPVSAASMTQVVTRQERLTATRQGPKHRRMGEAVQVLAGGQTQVLDQGIPSQADRSDAQGFRLVQKHAEHPGMEVKVQVPIDVIQG